MGWGICFCEVKNMRINQLVPPEIVSGVPRLTLTGRGEVVIQGHTGLISYETDRIRARCGVGVISIAGEKLTIDYFGAEDMLIRGRVDDIQISGEGR